MLLWTEKSHFKHRKGTDEHQLTRHDESPFGSAKYVLRIPPELKQGYKRLEEFSSYPLYRNCTATLPLHCNPSISGRRYLLLCRIATERKLQRSHIYVRCLEETKEHSFSLVCICEENRWHTPANTKVVFSLGSAEHTPPAHLCHKNVFASPLALLTGISVFADTEHRQSF